MSLLKRIEEGQGRGLASKLSGEGIRDLNAFLEEILVSYLRGENLSALERELLDFVVSKSPALVSKIQEFGGLKGEKPEKYVSSWVNSSEVVSALTGLAISMTD